MKRMSILEVNGLKKVYTTRFSGNKVEALRNVNFSVEEGEYVAIMGESGSGKTTLLNILAALDKPTGGTVQLDGKNLASIKDSAIASFRREHLGFVFQDFNLLDTLTLKENIVLAMALHTNSRKKIEERVSAVMKRLGIYELRNRFPYEVSGGQKQRCACARAIIHRPKLILADEPTGALDSHSAQMLLATMQGMNEHLGATLLVVTHDAMTASYAERILFLRDGMIFTELQKGNDSRKVFFEKILNVLTMMGGGQTNVCKTDL